MSIRYHEDMNKTRTTIRLEELDREAIAAIKQHYGITSDNDAIKLALRETHRQIKRQALPSRSK
jgi:Arc/MetJ family transcription regulator